MITKITDSKGGNKRQNLKVCSHPSAQMEQINEEVAEEQAWINNANESMKAINSGKIPVAVISNKQGFEKLKSNPLYERFYLKHCQTRFDAAGFFCELVVKINNPGMVDDGASEVLKKEGNYIWNKAALYEWAKEIEAHETH